MTSVHKGFSWGVGIWLLYGGFVVFILACVGFASMQSFDLVEDEYYERGVTYQNRIDKLQRTQDLVAKPVCAFTATSNAYVVTFPAPFDPDSISGTIMLYRPSNSRYDRSASIVLNSTRSMMVTMQGLPTGLWKAKLDWQYAGQTYYHEEIFVIGEVQQ